MRGAHRRRSAIFPVIVGGFVLGLMPPASTTGPIPPSHHDTRDNQSIEAGGYVFTDIELATAYDPETEEPISGTVRLRYRSGWGGATFPGTRVCTFEVKDASGSTIGHETHYFTGMGSAPTGEQTWVDVAVSGTPASGDIECDSQRLDDPLGQYEFSNVHVSTPSEHGAGDLDIVFDYEWVGDAGPSPQHCVAQVFGASGNLLGAKMFDFFAAAEADTGEVTPGTGTMYLNLNVTSETPNGATLRCALLTAAQVPEPDPDAGGV